MYFLYVDESGDTGKYIEGQSENSPHYILSGLLVNQDDWQTYLDRLKLLRQSFKETFGLLLKEEVHASELIRINKTEAYRKIKKQDRIKLLKIYSEQIPIIFNNSKIINICLLKKDFDQTIEIQSIAWSRLIQRFNNYLSKVVNDKGIIITDDTDTALLRNLLRKMRVYNPTPSLFGKSYYNVPTTNIIEDPFSRDSKHSYFIQSVDVIAQCLYRKEFPKGSLKKYNVHNYFYNFESILLKEASSYDDYGIVRK
ncbi:MAG: DUF3800 domain-containing protein [Ignavibacteria bacterium]|jgi:hypothetical protein